jgi:hypothetical protein
LRGAAELNEINQPLPFEYAPDAAGRIKRTSHEEVVEEVSAHPQRLSTPVEEDAAEVDDRAEDEAADHRDGHERAEVVDDMGEGEEAGNVETSGDNESGIEAGKGIAEVGEGNVVERGDGETCLSGKA